MKKLFTVLALTTLTACASTPINTGILVLTPKAGNTQEFVRDLDQCKYETSQRHRAKDPRAEALLADCMTIQKDYKLAEKQ